MGGRHRFKPSPFLAHKDLFSKYFANRQWTEDHSKGLQTSISRKGVLVRGDTGKRKKESGGEESSLWLEERRPIQGEREKCERVLERKQGAQDERRVGTWKS